MDTIVPITTIRHVPTIVVIHKTKRHNAIPVIQCRTGHLARLVILVVGLIGKAAFLVVM